MSSNEAGDAPLHGPGNPPRSTDTQDPISTHSDTVATPESAGRLARAGSWYYRNFLQGFCYYLPLLLLFLLPLGILFGSLGADYGPRLLFLHDQPLKQFLAGVSLALFWAEVLFVGYLLWLRHDREDRQMDNKEVSPWDVFVSRLRSALREQQLSFLSYSVRILGCIAATILVFVVVVFISGKVFDVFSVSATVDLYGFFKACGWLVFGVVITLLLFGLMRLLSQALLSLMRLLARLLGFARAAKDSQPESAALTAAESRPTPSVLSSLSWVLWGLVGIARWVSGPVVVVGWALALLMVGWWARGGWKFYGPLVFVAVGLLLTITAPFTDPRDGRRHRVPRPFFQAAVVANLLFVYALVSWCISNCPYGLLAGLLTAALCGLLLAFATQQYCRSRWDALLLSWQESLPVLNDQPREYGREREYLYWGLLWGAAIPVFLLVIAIFPALASPVPLAMFLLFGIVALYGLFTYFVRRSMIVVLGVVVLLAFVSHIQPYQMRFDRSFPYDGEDILDLRVATTHDLDRQAEFDDYFQQYRKNENDLADLDATISNLLKNIENADRPEVIDKLRAMVKALEQERQQGEQRREELTKKVRAAWRGMEQENRVRAGRLDAKLLRENPRLRLDDETSSGPPGLLRTKDLEVWRPEGAGSDDSQPLIVIAISGGGIRAAVWAFHVLTRLELEFARNGFDFPSNVRIITGASGGMLGGSYYVVTLPAPNERPPQKLELFAQREQTLKDQQRRLESSDFLTRLSQGLVFNDIPGWLSPWPARRDRGLALEEAWNYYLKQDPNAPPGAGKGALSVTFEDLREDERKGRRPSLVFTPMLIEDGRRLIVSNLDLRWTISNDGFAIPSETPPGEETSANPGGPRVQQYGVNHSIEALELFRLFPNARGKMTVATATRMSASFPYFSPAISLPTIPRRRVVDAGYYDNYGVSLTAAWLLDEGNLEWIQKHSGRRILFIQIRDGVTEKKRQLREPEMDGSDAMSRGLEELTSPLEGLYNARVSSSSFRNDGQLKLLAQVEQLWEAKSRLEEDSRRAQDDLQKAQRDIEHGIQSIREAEENLAKAKANLADVQANLKRMQTNLTAARASLESTHSANPQTALSQKGLSYTQVPFMVANFECEASASLSWYLSRREQNDIDNAATKIDEKIDRIIIWWTRGGRLEDRVTPVGK